jgi:hypothetical protein
MGHDESSDRVATQASANEISFVEAEMVEEAPALCDIMAPVHVFDAAARLPRVAPIEGDTG